jgi:predicted dehydrogenase
MTADKIIRWGVLAPGRIAHKFVQDLQTVASGKLMAVGSRDLGRAKDFAAQYNAPYAYGSYEELLQCPELDIVYVASPHSGHLAHTLLCLRAGVAVCCEKAFAINGSQVAVMIAEAQRKNVFLMEAMWARFNPAINKAVEIIESGAIGKVRLLRADFGFQADYDPNTRLFNKSLAGGALLDIGIYPLFLSYRLFGMPSKMEASAVFSETGIDETMSAILTYAHNNVMAVLDATFRATTPCIALIYGDKGSVEIHGRWHESTGITVKYTNGTTDVFAFERDTWGYNYEIEEVHRCLQNNQIESKNWSWQDSKNLMQLLDKVRQKIGLVYDNALESIAL